jgi:hypothetical protein
VDVAVYHTDFGLALLMVARYVARVCMQNIDSVSSNGASLLLYGAAGAGKSIITNTIAKYMNGYKWNADTIYQTPSLLSASVIIIEEIRLSQMSDSLYKQLLDITSYAKVEIKHAHPVDATRHCPVIANTNENVFALLHGNRGGYRGSSGSGGYTSGTSGGSRSGPRVSDEQLEAIRRRLDVVPFVEKFSKLHSLPISIKDPFIHTLFMQFKDMEQISPALFNFFIAFGLHQTYLHNFEVVSALRVYMSKLVKEFADTIFGQVYFTNKVTIDALLTNLEEQINEQRGDERQV